VFRLIIILIYSFIEYNGDVTLKSNVWEITGLFSVKASGMYNTSTYQYAVRIETKEGPTFLSDFAKLPKVTISFVIRLSVRPHRIPQLLLEGFLSNLTFECFSKIR